MELMMTKNSNAIPSRSMKSPRSGNLGVERAASSLSFVLAIYLEVIILEKTLKQVLSAILLVISDLL
jgi:hypothetical protein